MNDAQLSLQRLNELFVENTRLKAENDRLQDSISRLCADWSDDHTHLQVLCLGAGYTQQEVNECDPMPSIKDLADLLEKKIPQ
jgi:regulator of replication initiation timing